MGVIFEFDPNTLTYTKKFDFATGTATGHTPGAGLTLHSNGKLYGLTTLGGTVDRGVLYEFDPATGNYTKKIDFDDTNGWIRFVKN